MEIKKFNFKYLPAYASYLLENKPREFTVQQLSVFRDLDIPLLKFFSHFSDEELIEQGIDGTIRFLKCFVENKAKEFIEESIKSWLQNQIPMISREDLSPADISLVSFARRKLLRDFLKYYTTDSHLSLAIMEEVDIFTSEQETITFKNLLELQHSLYEEAEALAHLGNWTWDLNTKALAWSKEIFRIHELEPVPDASIYDIRSMTHPEDLALVDKELNTSRETHQSYDFYYRIKLKDGRIKHLHVKGKPEVNRNNEVYRMFGTMQDVTEQKLIEDQLKNSEERYHSMINEVQDYAIIRLNKSGDVENWNKGAEKIKGYSEEEILGKNFRIFYTPSDQAKKLPEQILNKAAIEGKASHEGWRMRKDRSVFWGSIVITALHDKKGNLTGFSKVTRDLTDIKIAEEKLREYADNVEMKNKKLEQANKELESFSYIASHDLQEPLRKIQAFTSRLLQKENDNLSEWGKDVFSKVQTSASRMQKLIEALLNFSRLDKTQDNFEAIDLNALLEEVKTSLHDSIESKQAVIESDKLPVISVIPIQFQQLFSNLISNALKYSRAGTPPKVKITYGLKEGNLIPGNSAVDRNKYHHLCFADTGIGFEQQYAEKIFELFQRLHGKSEYEGTGIGLAICKKIVDNHKGFILAESEPDKGAEFHVYIPSEKKIEIVNPTE
ncbi:MAG: cph1 [Bacteroidota bacterium]|jgi:PAS domain S-box-containing protein|nr:cph1 [Bacteroidota bacterium]